ncbi:MAG: transposase, partial [Nitrososphaeraceae archaeon]
GYMRVYFHPPYRQSEGVVTAHAGNKVPCVPNYSTISRRINNRDIGISEQQHVGKDIVIAVDSTGIKVANRGEWMRHKRHVRRGNLKIHVAIDIKNKKIISLAVTSEEIHDGKMLKNLIDNASENNNVKGVVADGMYDSNKNFRYLSKKNNRASQSTCVF